MRTRAGLSSENSDCEVCAHQTEDLLLRFLWVMGRVDVPTCICQISAARVARG